MGVTVRSLGGLGQFSAVSIRGSSAAQVPIFLDGVPIAGAFAGLVDLSTLPLDATARVVIHRGLVPAAYGGAVMGGAIDLQSARRRPDEGTVLSTTWALGSFGAHEVRGSVQTPLARRVSFSARAGIAGATGRFRYFDDGGTPQVRDDDTIAVRTNAGYERVFGHTRVDGWFGDWDVGGQVLAQARRAGVPGPASVQTTRSKLDLANVRGIFKARRRAIVGPSGTLEWIASAGYEARRYRDPLGELGVGLDDERLGQLDVFGGPRMHVPVWRGAHVDVVADARYEQVVVDERASGGGTVDASGDARRSRAGVGVSAGLEQRLARDRVTIAPTARIDAIDARFAVPASAGEVDDAGRDRVTFGFSPRVGARVRVTPALDFRASVGRAFRPPTLLELFGDRGFAIGNEGLRSERSTFVDAGWVYDRQFVDRPAHDRRHRRRLGRETWNHEFRAELAGFFTDARDLVSWVQTGSVVQPRNVSRAWLGGLETGVAAFVFDEILAFRVNYTFLHTEDRSNDPTRRGSALPGRPRHELSTHTSVGLRTRVGRGAIEPRLSHTLDVVSGSFLDPSGRFALPPRVLHGAGIELHVHDRVHVTVEGRNLANRIQTTWTPPIAGATAIPTPIVDFVGYPLPGLSVWASVTIALDLRDTTRGSAAP